LSRFAGKKKAVIFLILPLILISSIILLLAVTGNINFLNLLEFKYIRFLPLISIPGLFVTDIPKLFVIAIPVLIIFIASWIYGLHPAFIRTEKFFSKRGYDNVVLEYEFVKKLLFVIVILLAIVLIILYSNLFYQNNTLTNNTSTNNTLTNNNLTVSNMLREKPSLNPSLIVFDMLREKPSLNPSLIVFSTILTYIAIAAILRIATQNLKREFRFYFAKGCCKIMSNKNDKVEKIKYLFLLLSSYNKYLQRNLKIEINDIKKIYSIILSRETNQQIEIIESICVSLEGDKLKLARYLFLLQNIPDSEFYIKVSLFEQLKPIGAFLGAIITIIISIII
jgi:hypothetical protein